MSRDAPERNVYEDLVRLGVSSEDIRRLEAALRASPELEMKAKDAAASGALQRIGLLRGSNGPFAHYEFEGSAINFRPDVLGEAKGRKSPFGLIHIFGHEIYHANAKQESLNFDWKVEDALIPQFMSTHASSRDYTELAKTYRAYHRDNEAKAALSGANAVVSAMKQSRVAITEANLASALQGVSSLVVYKGDTPALAPGIHLNPPSQTFDLNDPKVVEAAAKAHFDKNPHYREEALLGAMELIARAESRNARTYGEAYIPSAKLDFKAFDVNPDALHSKAFYQDGPGVRGLPMAFANTRPRTDLGRPDFPITLKPRSNHPRVAPDDSMDQARSPAQTAPSAMASDMSHRQYLLREELKGLLPAQTSEDRLLQITAASHLGGVRPGWIMAVRATDEALFVIGQGMGERARVDLTIPPPMQAQSLQVLQQHVQSMPVQQGQMQQVSQHQDSPQR